MKANPLFPETFAAYKSHLSQPLSCHQSLSSFCRSRGVSYKSLHRWMCRRGLRVSYIQHESLLKRHQIDILQDSSRLASVLKFGENRSREIPLDRRVVGVTIAFPDGVSVRIAQTTAEALTKFIDSYNHLKDQLYVRAK